MVFEQNAAFWLETLLAEWTVKNEAQPVKGYQPGWIEPESSDTDRD